VWLLGSPPPETVAMFVTFAVMSTGTLTVNVIGGYELPGCRMSLLVQVSVPTLQAQPLPLIVIAVSG